MTSQSSRETTDLPANGVSRRSVLGWTAAVGAAPLTAWLPAHGGLAEPAFAAQVAQQVGPSCLIEGDFHVDSVHGNLEAVLYRDGQLHHVYGVPDKAGIVWHQGQTLPASASGPGSIIQADFGSGEHKNFEVVLWSGNELWHWWHDNSDVGLPWQRGQIISTQATGPGCLIQSNFGSGDHGNFEVVVLEGSNLVHYWHDNSDVGLPWQRGQIISTQATGPGCLIQSDFGSGEHGNFEVVVLEGSNLVHYWHDNSDVGQPWQRGQVISTRASAAGGIIQGPFGLGHKNFEVVVPEGTDLVHYWHDNSDVGLPWQRGQTVSVATTGAACIARSSYGPHGPGNFEVLVEELTKSVVHYWHHNVDVNLPWWRNFWRIPFFSEDFMNSPTLASTAKVAQLTGEYDRHLHMPTASRTESRYGVVGTDLGQSFEHDGRIVFLFGDTGTDGEIRQDDDNKDSIAFTTHRAPGPNGIELVFNRDYPHVPNIDQRTFCVPADGVSVGRDATGPGWLIRSDFGSGEHKNFEVVVLEGSNLVHWWHDNSDVGRGWQRAQVITTQATGPGCIIQSGFASGEHGNFEVVVLEGANLVHYWHDNSDVGLPWQRGQVISTQATGPGCIIQSDFGSGDHGNFEVVVLEGTNLVHYWHDNSDVGLPWQRGQIVSTHATSSGCLIQSDFGAGEHKNFEVVVREASRLVHYWHDNSNVNSPWQRGQTISTHATDSGCLIQGDFGSGGHKNFEVVVREASQLVHYWHDNSDVNLPWQRGQTITQSSMYVFFTTDRIEDPDTDRNSMGRSILARSEDGGINFSPPIYTMSTHKFVNLSIQVVDNAVYPGLPDATGRGILLWGSGGYRRSNVYLAYVRFGSLEQRSSFRFYTGLSAGGAPQWSPEEAQAAPLFLSGSVGELCVRWNPFLSRFILMYNGDNPGTILEHQSAKPWGPWTGGQAIFDYNEALGKYFHLADSNDGLSDPDKDSTGGAAYGPYMIAPYTTPNSDGTTTMYFVLSANNPYNTMLMKTTISSRS